jgi:hypothetical protein
MLSENQSTLDSEIGSANYDIGHVFGTAASGGSGLASLGVVGRAGFKGSGASTFQFPVGSDWLSLVAHEIGHQFGAEHTFNVSGVEREASNAYEPASGSTLMSYAGLFGSSDLQNDPDP